MFTCDPRDITVHYEENISEMNFEHTLLQFTPAHTLAVIQGYPSL